MQPSMHTPVIIIPGMFQSMITVTTPDEKKVFAWPPNINTDEVVKDLKSSFLKMMMFHRDMGLSDKIAGLFSDICEPLAYSSNGQPTHTIAPLVYNKCYAECTEREQSFIGKMFPVKDLTDIIGGENIWYFSYNFLSSPFESAQKLRELTELVKEKSGSEKVNFITLSLGAPVLNAYLSEYGKEGDTGRVVYFFSAANGSPVVADILGNTINTDGILSVIDILGGKSMASFASIAKMIPNGVVESAFTKFFAVMREKISVNSPFIWSLVPPAKYKELADKLLSDSSYSVLREQTDKYAAVLAALPETLTALDAAGTKIFVEAGYGRHLLALCSNDAVSSDTIVDTTSASFGVRTTENDNFSGEKHCNDTNHRHTTPDGAVDASYALFPETTWLFFEQKHAAASHNEEALEVAVRALTDTDFTDIYSVEELTQFGFSSDNRE